MTRLTAMIIQTRGDDVKVHVGKAENGLWGWSLDLYRGDEYDRLLLTAQCKHDDEKYARDEVEKFLKDVRECDLNKEFESENKS